MLFSIWDSQKASGESPHMPSAEQQNTFGFKGVRGETTVTFPKSLSKGDPSCSHQWVLPENAAAVEIYFWFFIVIFFFSSCHSQLVWSACLCLLIPTKLLVALEKRCDEEVRDGRGWGLHLSHQKQDNYKGNTFTFQKKSDWGTDPVSEELGAQKEVPVPGLFLSFSRQLCQI